MPATTAPQATASRSVNGSPSSSTPASRPNSGVSIVNDETWVAG